ncbi:DUF819 family protein [Persicobacter diffluens]|uniref:Beta-carotene 15,15'-monooxygenase n=1 Tax=Persicobacter diffluens TaxID=981 RepID=A0AAN4W0A0_9BACT|nr:beta-carotene 15,15'-monooxygenase [Persicobacter diffluens]
MELIVWSIFFLIAPLFVYFLLYRFPVLHRVGAVILSYGLGLLAGNIGWNSSELLPLKNELISISIPLAIPLLLFSSNIKDSRQMAGNSIKAMLAGMLSIILIVSLLTFTYHAELSEWWKIAGLFVGVYTGGTPNLASLKLMLEVDENTYLLLHTSDMILSGLFLLFLISIGEKVIGKVLGTPQNLQEISLAPEETAKKEWHIFKGKGMLKTLTSLAVSVTCLGLAYLLSLAFDPTLQTPVIMLGLTTLGIGASFIPRIRQLENSFDLGMYLILVFSTLVASMVQVEDFFQQANGSLFFLTAIVLFSSLLLHLLLCKILKVDAHSMIISATALVCSPPFVPMVAGALKNKKIILSGLTIGIIGYAVGNYLGYFIAISLKSIP